MSNATPRTPADHIAGIVSWIIRILDTQSMYGPFPRPLAQLIGMRLIRINQLFRRIADRIAAGTYAPRRQAAAPRRRPGQPPPKNPLPNTFGWLLKLVPGAGARGSQLGNLLLEPEMAALLAAAPVPLRRPLRSLCRMLGVRPPPILALPARPRPARPPPAQPPPAPPQAAERAGWPPRRASARWPRGVRVSLAPRTRGPPRKNPA